MDINTRQDVFWHQKSKRAILVRRPGYHYEHSSPLKACHNPRSDAINCRLVITSTCPAEHCAQSGGRSEYFFIIKLSDSRWPLLRSKLPETISVVSLGLAGARMHRDYINSSGNFGAKVLEQGLAISENNYSVLAAQLANCYYFGRGFYGHDADCHRNIALQGMQPLICSCGVVGNFCVIECWYLFDQPVADIFLKFLILNLIVTYVNTLYLHLRMFMMMLKADVYW